MSQETIVELAIDRLHDSPFNPRKIFDQSSLEEMAQTMRPPHGRVQQPIVVRPKTGSDDFEIVFGHRRRRAGELAGRETMPAIVRAMTDEEAKRAQVVENLQRVGVSPLDEADAMKELREQHGATIEDLMQQAGKSRTYVYNRLRLADASSQVREAVIEGQCDAEVAQEVARLPAPLQPRALYAVRALSYRGAKAQLESSFQFKLRSAPFDVLSIKLLPEAGACDACPKRSDAEPVLMEECGSDVCMDGVCYGKKAVIAREIREREAREKATAAAPVAAPPPVAAKTKDDPNWPFGTQATLDGLASHAEAASDAAEDDEQLCGGDDDDDPVRAALRTAAADTRAPAIKAVMIDVYWLKVVAALAQAFATQAPTTDDMRMVLRAIVEPYDSLLSHATLVAMGWLGDLREAVDEEQLVRHKIATATANELATMLLLEAVETLSTNGPLADRPSARQALCQRYGVDPIAVAGLAIEVDDGQIDLVAQQQQETVPPPPSKPKAKAGVKYRDPDTGSTWSGKGLKPKWLTVALDRGRTLSEFQL